MADQIIINPAEIEATADAISNLNKQINNTLEATKQQFNSTADVWKGEAAEETRNAYNSFAERYFSTYQELINDYVKFLNETAAEGWRTREDNIKSQADNIKSQIA